MALSREEKRGEKQKQAGVAFPTAGVDITHVFRISIKRERGSIAESLSRDEAEEGGDPLTIIEHRGEVEEGEEERDGTKKGNVLIGIKDKYNK